MHASHQKIKKSLPNFRLKQSVRYDTPFSSKPEFCHVFTDLEILHWCTSRVQKVQKIKPQNSMNKLKML